MNPEAAQELTKKLIDHANSWSEFELTENCGTCGEVRGKHAFGSGFLAIDPERCMKFVPTFCDGCFRPDVYGKRGKETVNGHFKDGNFTMWCRRFPIDGLYELRKYRGEFPAKHES